MWHYWKLSPEQESLDEWKIRESLPRYSKRLENHQKLVVLTRKHMYSLGFPTLFCRVHFLAMGFHYFQTVSNIFQFIYGVFVCLFNMLRSLALELSLWSAGESKRLENWKTPYKNWKSLENNGKPAENCCFWKKTMVSLMFFFITFFSYSQTYWKTNRKWLFFVENICFP